jgi:hypothetical protein
MSKKHMFLAFLECVLKGEWEDQPIWDMHYFKPKDDQNELWIVRPDGLKRAFRFKTGSSIKIAQNNIKFTDEDLIEELAVDEDERSGKPPLSKLKID